MAAATTRAPDEVVAYLEQNERKDILRFVTVGSVDDGKSTLIGRLLHDSHGVYEDQLRAVRRASIRGQGAAEAEIDFSLFTDGLKAEREQGITIDVAYRYFATNKRKFIIADTPGHTQYTRNMATGASTASVAIILIDARFGVVQQSRRHAFIASLLGIPELVVGVNKMDLVGYDGAVYGRIERDFGAFVARLGFDAVTYVPISALRGDNVVRASEEMPFYRGPTLLEVLENVSVDEDRNLRDFRYPVQAVLRPNLDYRGYAGQIASGVVRVGDAVVVLPSKKASRIVGIDRWGEELREAFAPMSVTLRLADEIDISRGDMLVHPTNVPRIEQRFDAMMVWLHDKPLDRRKSYLLKHTTQIVRADVEEVAFRIDLDSLEDVPGETLALNDIGRVTVRTYRPLFVDDYETNRATGAFVLVDSLTNDTVAAGMILEPRAHTSALPPADLDRTQVSPSERRERIGHGGAAVVTSELAQAFAIERELFDRGCIASVVEGNDAVAAAEACARAGILAVCVLDDDGARALEARLGAFHVVRCGVAGRDAVSAAISSLAQRGVIGPA